MNTRVAANQLSVRQRSAFGSSLANLIRQVGPPAVSFLLILTLWEFLSVRGIIPDYVLPSPSSIAVAGAENAAILRRNAMATVSVALLGLALGTVSAIAIAVLTTFVSWARRGIYPLAMAVKSVPIVAIIPVLILWFGPTLTPRILIAAFTCFFPTLVNMVRGLNTVDPEIDELMHSMSTSSFQRVLKVQAPGSLPFLFTSLKIGAATCFVGAVVSEWVGASDGLGHLIIVFGSYFNIPEMWAAIVVVAGLTLATFSVVAILEYVVMPWMRHQKARGNG